MSEQAKEPSGQQPLIDTKGLPDWVGHVITGVGSMAGNYFLSIRPLQDRMKELEREVQELKELCQQLRLQSQENERKVKNLEQEKQSDQQNPFAKQNYLPMPRSGRKDNHRHSF